MVILKPLYKIAKVETYQWAIYSKHHKEKLLITTSIFNPYFLIITTKILFRIVSIQTNNIIILGDNQFSALKEDKLIKTNLIAKLKERLNLIIPLLFNRCILSLNKDSIVLCQKGQSKKIKVININSLKKRYMEQRARGAYITFIC